MPSSLFLPPAPELGEHYTFSVEEAAGILGCTTGHVERLVEYTRNNAVNGISGPLRMTSNGHSIIAQSAFAYRDTLTSKNQ
ncbi:hypothetical protein [Streptomyces albidoflavus]|uniref:hypothetical protein n=1 Tax=Streptomyces albidoflavus TaxID=1886 RepID=UPI0033F133DF